MNAHGSPFWQTTILFAGCIFLLFHAYRGWRAGVIRAGIGLAALVLSSLLGWAALEASSTFLGGKNSAEGLLVGFVLGAAVALAVYLAIWFVGALLFKRTAQHSSGILRLLWGAGGALCGLFFGLLILWGGITVVRGLGALAEGRAASAAANESSPPAVAGGLIKLRDSLEIGPAGLFFQKVDAVPDEAYETISDLSRLTSDPAAMSRFIEYPGIQALLNNPKIVRLLNDPKILRAAEARNPLPLIANPAILQTAKDPELAAAFEKIDFADALRFALKKPPYDKPKQTAPPRAH